MDDHDEAVARDSVSRRASRLGHGETLIVQDKLLVFTLPLRAKFHGGRAHVRTADGRAVTLNPRVDPVLIKAVARAHVWSKMLSSGEVSSVEVLAERVQQDRGYVAR